MLELFFLRWHRHLEPGERRGGGESTVMAYSTILGQPTIIHCAIHSAFTTDVQDSFCHAREYN
jgi:hypothetical protein